MVRLSLFFLLLVLGFLQPVFGATSAIEKQLRNQREVLKKMELELEEQRKQLKAMESEEKGVLNTISLLDHNLGQTKDYLREIVRTEGTLNSSVGVLRKELDSIGTDVDRQQEAMKKRIRELYMQGRRSQVEQLWQLLQKKESPDRSLYQVRRLLRDDEDRVSRLHSSERERLERQNRMESRISELSRLRRRKAEEEAGLATQIASQETALDGLRRDKDVRQKALEEFERNQRMMIALIETLETRRKQEEVRKRKENEERKRKGQKPQHVTEAIVAVGPKCVPLKGELISEFGMHEHPILRTLTRNLGIEIRATRGAPVKVAAAGSVIKVASMGGRGTAVIVQHGDVFTVYGHLRNIMVREGQALRYCQVIGEASDDDSMNGPKLYFQVSQAGRAIDPQEWLRSEP
jgi:septal ring factor EnvC (AmiA/AmiB activator)